MDNVYLLFICFQLCLFYLKIRQKSPKDVCENCKDKPVDAVETLCGHLFCFECLNDETCKCGHKISLLYPQTHSRDTALHNIIHSFRSFRQILIDWMPITTKIMTLTTKLDLKPVWRAWMSGFGLIYLQLYLKLDNFFLLGLGIIAASVFTTLVFHSHQVQSSATYLSNPQSSKNASD